MVAVLDGLFLLNVAITAIDRTAFGWLERHLGLGTAFGAGYRVHLSGATPIAITVPPAGGPALGASTGVILETMRLIEFLLTDCEHKFLSAITTAQFFFFQCHLTAPPYFIRVPRFRCSHQFPSI